VDPPKDVPTFADQGVDKHLAHARPRRARWRRAANRINVHTGLKKTR
jgi:hypothetical protein